MSAKARPSSKIEIDPEFSKLIPRITTSEYKELEQNIIKDGCREPLSLWQNILLDGHNRYKICKKNNIKFNTIDIKLESRDAAKIWIIHNQLGRRNLNAFQRIELVIPLEELYRAKGIENKKEGGKMKLLLNSVKAVNTQKEMAKLAGVSHDTYYKGKKIIEKAPEEDKEAIRNGNQTIEFIYCLVKAQEDSKKPGRVKERAEMQRVEDDARRILDRVNLSYIYDTLNELSQKLKNINFSKLKLGEEKKEILTKALIPALTAVKDCLTRAEKELKTHNNIIDV